MKNKLFFLLFIASVSSLCAQMRLDTISRMDSCYMFNPYLNENGEEEVSPTYHSGGWAQLYMPSGPTALYGIAIVLPEQGTNNPHYHFNMELYQKIDGMFRLTDSVERQLPMPQILFNYSGNDRYTHQWFSDVYVGEEYYFDYPVTVNDSFFVVKNRISIDTGVWRGWWGTPQIINYGVTSPWLNASILRYNESHNMAEMNCREFTVSPHYPGFNPNNDNCEYLLLNYNIWGGIFPITGFHCKQTPRFPTVETCTPTYAVVGWVYSGASEYEVAVGDYDKPVDSAFARYTVTDIHCRIDSLEPSHHYGVWVRQPCRYTTVSYDTVVWGPWSSKVELTTPVGIEDVSAAALTLGPNPAHQSVCLTTQEPMHSVSISDMAGREVLRRTEPGTRCELDISALPAGIYLVRVLTDSGQTLRRLTVD